MNIVKINDINDSRLDKYYRDTEKQLHKAFNKNNGYFVVESELIINRCINAGYNPISFLIKDNEEDKYIDILSKYNCDIYEISEELFKQLKGYLLIRDIMAIFQRKPDKSIEEVCKDSRRIVVLENVENPTNVGAIFRNAAALFVDGILLTNDSSDPLYRRSIRVSMGNVFNMKYTYVNKDKYMDKLHELGFKTVALALRNNCLDIDDERLKNENKLAIILGSEGYGLIDETIDKSDYVVKIKMNENVDSLNVASASGVALYELCKKDK